MIWTDKHIKQLQELWAKGKTSGEIAIRLKTTRGSVMGKIRRLGLPRKKPVKKKAVIVRKAVVGYTMARIPKLWSGVVDAVFQLKKQDCRWPVGDTKHRDFKFCCQPKTPDSPYCVEHKAMAWVEPRNRFKR
jgi:GcrA cell cycle regulator